AGAIGLLVAAWPALGGAAFARARTALAMIAALAGLVPTVRLAQSRLAAEPVETRVAGEWLRAQHATGAGVARKPHVAYFANLDYVALPDATTLGDLYRAARASGVQYLFLSGIEHALRPQYRVFTDPQARLRGIEKLHEQIVAPKHYYSLFRIGNTTASD